MATPANPVEIDILLVLFSMAVGAVITWWVAKRYYVKAAKDLERETKELRQQSGQIMRYLVERDKGDPPDTEVTEDNEILHHRTLKLEAGKYGVPPAAKGEVGQVTVITNQSDTDQDSNDEESQN